MEVDLNWEEISKFLRNFYLENLDEKDDKIIKLCLFIVDNKEALLSRKDSELEKFSSLLFGLTANVLINSSNQLIENELLLRSTIEVIFLFCLSHLKIGSNDLMLTEFQLVKLLVGLSTCKSSLNKDEVTSLLSMDFVLPAFLLKESQSLLSKSLFAIDLNKVKCSDWKLLFTGYAAAILRKEKALNILINVISSFKELHSFAEKYDSIFNDLNPQSITAVSILNLETQLMIIVEVLKLPIIDQMTNEQLEFIVQLVENSLKAALFIASGYFVVNKKENEADSPYEEYCRKHEWKSTEHCLAMLSAVSEICVSSTHIDRFVGLNLEARSVLTILKILQRLTKKQQEQKANWLDDLNISLITMTSRIILLLSNLYDNIQLEGDCSLQSSRFNIFSKSTACDRLHYIIENVHLPSLLLDLFLTSYDKTLNLLIKQNDVKNEQMKNELKVEASSDEDSSLEEGSMLGSFFVKTINDSDKVDTSIIVKEKERNTSPQSTEILELLASSLIEFISKFFPMCVENGFKQQVKESLTEERLDRLAKIIMGCSFGGSIEIREIKEHISKLFGYLVTTELLQQSQMHKLLKTLGISVSGESSNRQLNLSIHVLRIFVHLVLLSTSENSEVVINSWKLLINALIDSAQNGSKEYLNVQHAQAMIMVYQLISREKKEIVFNEIILAVTKLSAIDIKGTIHVAHLILFFDYMMHSCYSTESNDIIKQVQHNILSTDADKPSYVKSLFKEEDQLENGALIFYGLIEKDKKKVDNEVLTYLKKFPDYSLWYSSFLTLMAKMTDALSLGGELLDMLGARNAFLHMWFWLQELPVAIEWMNKIDELEALESSHKEYLFYICWMPPTFEMSIEQIENELMVLSTNNAKMSERNLFASDIPCTIIYLERLVSLLSSLLNNSNMLTFSPFAICDSIVSFIWVLIKQILVYKKEEVLKYGEQFCELVKQIMLLLKTAVKKSKELVIKLATSNVFLDNEIIDFYIDVIGLDLPTANSRTSDIKRIQVLPENFCNYVQDWQNLHIQVDQNIDDLQENKDVPFSTIATNYVRDSLISHQNVKKSEPKGMPANATSLKRLIHSLSSICNKVLPWMNTSMSEEFQTLKHLGMSLYSGFWFDYLLKHISFHSEQIIYLCLGDCDQDKFETAVFIRILEIIEKWYMKELSKSDRFLDEAILIAWLKFLMDLIEHSKTLVIFSQYFAKQPLTLFSIFKSVTKQVEYSNHYLEAFIQFFSKLFLIKEKSNDGIVYTVLLKIFEEGYEIFYAWMKSIIFSKSVNGSTLVHSLFSLAIQNSQSLDKALTALLAINDNVVSLIIKNELPDTLSFPLLFDAAIMTANSCGGQGHVLLLQKAIHWLKLSTVADKNDKHAAECIQKIVLYITDIITNTCNYDVSEENTFFEMVPEIFHKKEEQSEECVNESIEGNTCTFSVTQRDFMNQHWYHCHTCKMNDGIGCCTVCAKVCHKDHDVTYAKHGSFFCDCGAKEDGSCKAMSGSSGSSKLSNRISSHLSTWGPSTLSDKSLIKMQKYQKHKTGISKGENNLHNVLQDSKVQLLSVLSDVSLFDSVLQLLKQSCDIFTHEVEEAISEIKSQKHKLKEKLELLYASEKEFCTDNIMNAVSGSQEGAFENIKLTYGGEQGATLRQLINSHMIHHKAMCLIVSPFGKRQFLAVAHEKGKVTILQLSGLLRLPESNQKKMTLNRLSSTIVPFTVLHMVSNSLNDEFLAVTGLKDCLVLILGNSASAPTRLTLNIKLDTGNFIIKALWVPGSQTQLALLTADYIKIFDLSVSETDPIHYFVVPSGKIRDATFIPDEKQTNIVIMSSQGYIYVEALNDASKQCVFYTMNVVSVQHPNTEESDQALVNGGGVSIYYSHTLKLLFFSYNKGLSFFGCLDKSLLSFTKLFLIDSPIALSSPLVQWNEVPGQVGLLHCTQQNTGNVIMLAVKPDKVIIQEVKSISKSVKVLSAVCHHHSTIEGHGPSVTECTTLIVLLDDGSLRIYNANQDIIQFLKPPENLFKSTHFTERLVNKEKKQESKKIAEKFPVDFFESCHLTNDVEFGGEDILHIYNKNQVKNRLNTTGMYIANTKPSGFKIEIYNTNLSNVVVGIRLQVGVQSMERSPQYVDIFGRVIYLRSVKNRWFDIPFTREESNICLEKNAFTVTFGPSTDPYGVSIVDSIKVYTKTKEEFNLVDENAAPAATETPSSSQELLVTPKYQSSQSELLLTSLLSAMNKLLKVVDGSKILTVFDTLSNISSKLFTVDPQLQENVSAIGYQTHLLLKNLYPGEGKYQVKKDEILITHMMKIFEISKENLDMDAFEMVLNIGSFVGETQADNLVKFVEASSGEQADKFAKALLRKFWKLYENYSSEKNSNANYQDSWHMENTVEVLVGLIFSIMLGDTKYKNAMSQLIFELLLVKDQMISFAAKRGLTKALLLRQTHVKQVESNDVPITAKENKKEDLSPSLEKVEVKANGLETSLTVAVDNTDHVEEEIEEEDDIEDMEMMDDEGDIDDGDLQMLIDDDNAMMEIALALSLQNDEENDTNEETQQESKSTPPEASTNEQFDRNIVQDASVDETPLEQGDLSDGQGSISESPNYIEGPNLLVGGNVGLKFSALWSQLLEIFEAKIPYLLELDGLQAIPFLQVMLMLCSNLMVEREEDKAVLRRIIVACINPLQVKLQTDSSIPTRTASSEVQLVLMRFLSVLMSRCNANKQGNVGEKSSSFDAYVATVLQELGLVEYCLCLLKSLLSYWKSQSATEDDNTSETTLLLKAKALHPTPDMMPFFMEQYVKSHAVDLFEAFPQLVSEMVLRMPYQIHKLIDVATVESCFSKDWVFVLCEYMMISHAPFVRRQVRKLLLALCGTKEKYRFVKDLHNIHSHLACLKSVLQLVGIASDENTPKNISLTYEETVTLTEQISACIDIATVRNENWLLFCKKEYAILPFLMEASYQLDEHISSKIIELIFMALSLPHSKEDKKEIKCKNLSVELIKLVFSRCYGTIMLLFIKSFLLESNSSQLRWKVHGLIHSIFLNIDVDQQVGLTELMWTLWNVIPSCGHRATQFTDLLGFFTIKTMRYKNVTNIGTTVMSLLHEANTVLMNHPNASLYRKLCNSVELEGYYLESDPCAVCNNPEVAFNSYKLSSVKSDIRYTPKSQLIKLSTNHTISKIMLKVSDIKRAKMVKSMVIFYNNKLVPSVVELKKSGIWQKAKKVFLTQGQTDVKVEFAFPITACNLMIEFSSFYDNVQFSAESLQCPRCSASVPAHPGICGNCGENVYQCHKCRAINYDERDPFLCTLCGFCKYAKFEFVLSAHSCCTVETINNEEERQKALKAVNGALEKADQYYQALTGHRQMLESLLRANSDGTQNSTEDELPTDKALVWNVSPLSTNTQTPSTAPVTMTSIKRSIQGVAQLYCIECKASFDNMSKATQTVTALRKELLQYDMKQQEALSQAMYLTPEVVSSPSSLHDKPQFYRLPSFSGVSEEVVLFDKQVENLPRVGKCYGCALSTVHHCLTILRALSTIESAHECLLTQGCLQELVTHNLQLEKKELVALARTLLIKLTSENKKANETLNEIICERIKICLSSQAANMSNISLSSELSLLRQSVANSDVLWEQRLSCVFMLLLDSLKNPSTEVLESITLPCLEIINSCVKPKPASNKKVIRINKSNHPAPTINIMEWLKGDYTFQNWKVNKSVASHVIEQPSEKKYSGWLKKLLFASSSRATRQSICSILEQITLQSSQRKDMLLQLLMSYLSELRTSGENSSEYLALLRKILSGSGYKVYMSNSGILDKLCQLIVQEVEHLTVLERSTLNVDLAQGFSLFALADLLKSFLEDNEVKFHCQRKYVAEVLQCYLSLRKLVVQRTKLIDQTQDILLALLEQLNSGTEDKFFMKTCIDALKSCPINDIRTPIFIFEQLCNTIYKAEVESAEFFMTLEKDPQQEDFLQGRMHGNPYSSNQPGLGPLMRDIKNTICTECELVALLEDDTGMELLVNNKIISLDLPVLQVYKKVWCSKEDHKDPMRIVYRMRGLLGDATEDIIENLSKEKANDVDEESQYQRAAIMVEINGLEVVLKRLSYVRDLSRAQHLVAIILKLLEYCIKVKVNRQYLIQPSLCGMKILLSTLNHALRLERDYGSKSGGAMLAERVLKIMEVVLHEATIQGDLQQIDLPDEESQLELLLNHITSPYVRSNANVLQAMMKLTPFLTFGSEESMLSLIEHFLPYLDFDKFDNEKSADSILQLDCLCMIAEGISKSDTGLKLKDMMVREGIVSKALSYLQSHTPPQSFRASGILDSAKWKEFIAKPSLPYILRLLTGLLRNHQSTQLLISTNENVALIHHLEQISSEEMVGSLAENLMEALRLFPEGKIKVAEVRRKTRDEKKALAMAMRQKQLDSLGMTVTGSGQIKTMSPSSKEIAQLLEEQDQRVVCSICREGYKFYPNKVLGVYTYTSRCILDEFESKTKKTHGYSSVSHFNVIHFDCHIEAVRHARSRDEWESAALQNANTKCNGLLPLWGPEISESSFASCLARHNNYIQECTGLREPTFHSNVHDIRLMLLKFAHQKSFSHDAGGGGKHSNMYLIPYMVNLALYVVNSTHQRANEEQWLNSFLDAPLDNWVASCYELNGPMFASVLSLFIMNLDTWKNKRILFLKRLLLLAHVRDLSNIPTNKLMCVEPSAFSVYKPILAFFSLIDKLHSLCKSKILPSDDWSQAMSSYLRNNDEQILKECDNVLKFFEEDVLSCESFAEYCDVAGILSELDAPPDQLIRDLLKQFSTVGETNTNVVYC